MFAGDEFSAMHHVTGHEHRRCRAHHTGIMLRHTRSQRFQSPAQEFSPEGEENTLPVWKKTTTYPYELLASRQWLLFWRFQRWLQMLLLETLDTPQSVASGACWCQWRECGGSLPGGRDHPEKSASFARLAGVWQNSGRIASTSWARACGDRQSGAARIGWKERDTWHTTCFKAGMHRRRGPA